MEIRLSDKFCIITPLSPKLNFGECKRLFNEIKANSDLRVGLDLTFVQDCTIEFIEELYKLNKIGIFNIQSNIFALFNIMKVDKCVNLFVSEQDFITDKNRLVNRNFYICNT